MRPKFPPSARIDFQVTGYVPHWKKLDEVCVVGPRKEQSLKALGGATRGAKFTSLTAITLRRRLYPVLGYVLNFRGGWEGGVVQYPCQPCLGQAWLGRPRRAPAFRCSPWRAPLPPQFLPMQSTPSVPMTATAQQLAKNRAAAPGHPPTTGLQAIVRWRIALPLRARIATATYLAGR
jgi:hypothetical protein